MSKMVVKVTQEMLTKASNAVAGDDKVLARVLAVLHSMKLEPAVNSETAWIHKPSGTIKEGDSLGISVKAKLLETGFKAELIDVLGALKNGKDLWETFLEKLVDGQRESVNKYTEWLEKFYELGETGWSEVDDLCWGSTMHSWDDEGRKIIVVPSERRSGGLEYKIVGVDPDDIVENSYGRSESLQANVKEHFTKNMVKATKTHAFDEKTYPLSAITGKYISAAAIDSGLISYTVVHSVIDGKAIGLQLAPGGDGLDYKMLTPSAYLRRTYSNLVSNKERCIEHISTISNDPNEPTLCYIRNDYNEGDCPTWTGWIDSTFDDPEEDGPYFMAWLGSSLDANNRGKQACVIHGYGSQGLSKVTEALSTVFGTAFTALSGSKSMTNQFGTAKLEGKRLVVIADNKNPKILMTEWVHNLTGGDTVDIERKQKDSHAARLMGKLLICGNIAPEVNFDEQNQKNRVLYIKLKHMTDEDKAKSSHYMQREDGSYVMVGDSEFPEKLKAEVEPFLCLCSKYYKKYAPTRSDIILSKSKEDAMEAALCDTETCQLQRCIDSMLEFGKDYTCDPNELYDEYKRHATDLDLPCTDQFFGSRVKAFLHNLGVDYVRPRTKDDTGKWVSGPKVVRGARLKQDEPHATT